MNFWIKNLVLGGILIVVAFALLYNQGMLKDVFSANETEATDTGNAANIKSTIDPVDEPTQQVKRPLKTENAAAQGLSRFYANLHGGFGEEARIRNNVVYLPEPNDNLEEILKAKALVTRPLRESWRGNKENRPFREGQTLFQKLSEYAEQEGLEVIWWLNRDLIIKDPFRINKELLNTAYMIGNTIEGHFPNGLKSYFCNKHRSIVLIENDIEYLQQECVLLDPTTLKGGRRRQ